MCVDATRSDRQGSGNKRSILRKLPHELSECPQLSFVGSLLSTGWSLLVGSPQLCRPPLFHPTHPGLSLRRENFSQGTLACLDLLDLSKCAL